MSDYDSWCKRCTLRKSLHYPVQTPDPIDGSRLVWIWICPSMVFSTDPVEDMQTGRQTGQRVIPR